MGVNQRSRGEKAGLPGQGRMQWKKNERRNASILSSSLYQGQGRNRCNKKSERKVRSTMDTDSLCSVLQFLLVAFGPTALAFGNCTCFFLSFLPSFPLIAPLILVPHYVQFPFACLALTYAHTHTYTHRHKHCFPLSHPGSFLSANLSLQSSGWGSCKLSETTCNFHVSKCSVQPSSLSPHRPGRGKGCEKGWRP